MNVTRRKFLALSMALAGLVGCEKWKKPPEPKANPFELTQLKTSRSSIKFEFGVLKVLPYRRHLMEEAWSQIDQQMIDFSQRQLLESNGLRVGVTGSNLPPNLSLLLQPPAIDHTKLSNLEKQMIDSGVNKPVDLMEQHIKISLVPNKTKDLSFGTVVPDFDWQWNNGKGIAKKSYHQVKPHLRLVAQQSAGRSVQLGMIPFLTFGNRGARYEVKQEEFQMVLDQRQILLPEAGTKMQVSLGQTVVIGPTADQLNSDHPKFGHRFFGVNGDMASGNRLVMMRLIHTGQPDLFGGRVRSESLVNDV